MKRCSKKLCCKQCRYVTFKGTMTKWPVQKPTYRTRQNTKRHRHYPKQQKTHNKNMFVFVGIFLFSFFIGNFLNKISTVNFYTSYGARIIYWLKFTVSRTMFYMILRTKWHRPPTVSVRRFLTSDGKRVLFTCLYCILNPDVTEHRMI